MADQSLLGAIMGGFRSPREAFLETIQMRQAVVQQEQQREEARKMQAAVQDYMSAPNPQKLANLQFQFPALKDSLNAYQQTLTDADRRTTLDFANQAFALTRAGRESDVLSLFDEYVTAAENAGQAGVAKAMRDAKRTYEAVPDRTNREALLGSLMGGVGKEGLDLYEKVWATPVGGEATAFQKDFEFVKKTFGEDAAAEFAQYGRSGIVSIPLGDGSTYVGPAALAPGASRWRAQPTMEQPQQQQPQQPKVDANGAAPILGKAARSKRITQAEANVIKQSLGPKGQGKFNEWLEQNKIKIVVRTGTAPDGRRVVQLQDGTVEYGD